MSNEITSKENMREITSLDNDVNSVMERVIEEKDPEKVKDLTSLFNMHMNKKNMARIVKLNDLLDNVVDQSITRFENNPNNFSNKELIDYMNVVQKTTDASFNQLKEINAAPTIQVNNNQTEINIQNSTSNLNNLNRDSRKKILDAIDAIIKNKDMIKSNDAQDAAVDVEVVNKETNGDI